MSFTLSQVGMVRHWWKLREPAWRRHMVINGVGAISTGIVLLVVIQAKFLQGAWIVAAIIPTYVAVMYKIHRHYEEVRSELTLEGAQTLPPIQHHRIIVPVGGIHQGVLAAPRYAKSLSSDVEAVIVDVDPRRTAEVAAKWKRWGMDVPLTILPSPYRSMVTPIIRHLDGMELELGFDEPVTLVVPEFVPDKLWQFFLHGQAALMLKVALYFRRRAGHRVAVVTSVPYYLGRPDPIAEFEDVRPTILAPAATLGLVLLGVMIALVVAVTHAWPPLLGQLLGIVAVLLTAALFFMLLVRSMFS